MRLSPACGHSSLARTDGRTAAPSAREVLRADRRRGRATPPAHWGKANMGIRRGGGGDVGGGIRSPSRSCQAQRSRRSRSGGSCPPPPPRYRRKGLGYRAFPTRAPSESTISHLPASPRPPAGGTTRRTLRAQSLRYRRLRAPRFCLRHPGGAGYTQVTLFSRLREETGGGGAWACVAGTPAALRSWRADAVGDERFAWW